MAAFPELAKMRMSIAQRAAHVYFLTIKDDDERDRFWCGHFVFRRDCQFCVFAQVYAWRLARQIDKPIWDEVN